MTELLMHIITVMGMSIYLKLYIYQGCAQTLCYATLQYHYRYYQDNMEFVNGKDKPVLPFESVDLMR